MHANPNKYYTRFTLSSKDAQLVSANDCKVTLKSRHFVLISKENIIIIIRESGFTFASLETRVVDSGDEISAYYPLSVLHGAL